MLFAISSLTHPTLCFHRARQHLYQGVCRRGMQCGQKPSKPDLSPLSMCWKPESQRRRKHPEPSPTYDSMILWSETLPSKNRTFRHCHRALNPTPTPLSSCREPNITLINLDGDRNHHCWTNLEHSWGIMIQQPTRNFTNPIRTR